MDLSECGVRSKPASRERIYAIGDIHGFIDLFSELTTLIRLDSAARERQRTRLIILGNFIDRGPSSAPLAAWLYRVTQATDRVIVLKGEREQIMIQALNGDVDAFDYWLSIGGAATLASFGLQQEVIFGAVESAQRVAKQYVSPDLLHWIERLPLFYRSGDYFFVHAGIRPGVPLTEQRAEDLLQIEDEFLEDTQAHPAVIVHGHAFCGDEPQLLNNRIAVNTGAFKTRRLSAVGLEQNRQWTLTT